MILPVIIPLLPNEYLYSYLLRTAKANGFRSLATFINAYLFPESDRKTVTFEMFNDLSSFFDTLLIPEEKRMNWIIKTTIYPALSLWMSEGQKTHNVLLMTPMSRQYPHLISPMKPRSSFLKYCPECMKEDRERYGFFYARRNHQISGIRICTRHHVLLQGVKQKDISLTEPLVPRKLYTDEHVHDFGYAALCEQLIDWPLNKEILCKTMSELLKSIDLNQLREVQESYPYPSSMNTLMMLENQNENYLNFESMMSLLLCLIKNYGLNLPLGDLSYSKFPDGFEMIDGDERIATFKHKKCGRVFISRPQSLKGGWGCPYCEVQDEQSKFVDVAERADGYNVKVITPFQSMQKTVEMRCRKCGRKFVIKPVNFLELGNRCSCENKSHSMTKPEALEMVEGNGEYKLIKFNGPYENMRVKCLACNHTFEVKPYEFKKHPFCRKCAELERNRKFEKVRMNQNKVTAASIRKYVKTMTGDAFEVLKIVHHNMTLKCSKCQKVFTMTYEQFKRGNRCSCYKYPCGGKFLEYVDIVTNHEYSVNRLSYSQYLVKNKMTGEKMKMTKLEIMAELRMPGVSKKMPVANRQPYLDQIKGSCALQIEDYLDQHYHVGDEFRACDLVIEGLSSHSIRNCLSSTLKKRSIVTLKTKGIYIYQGKYNGKTYQ